MSSRWQNGFVTFFWAASFIWMVYMIQNLDFANFIPAQLAAIPGFREYVLVITYLWWCFAGFETAVGMGGEIKFPQINIPRALLLSPFLIFAVSALFQFFLVGIISSDLVGALADASAPYAEGLQMAGYIGFPLILLCIAIAFGGDMSTMNPGVAAPSRYIFQMGQDHVLPSIFGKIHPKFQTPYVAVVFVGVVAFLLILTNSITIIAEISMVSLFWCYIIGFISFARLRKKESNLRRPYKMPFHTIGVVISIASYLLMMWSIGLYHFLLSFIITAVCLLFYFFYSRNRAISSEKLIAIRNAEAATLAEDIPTPVEKAKMDREYKIWKIVIFCVFSFTLLLYLIAFIR